MRYRLLSVLVLSASLLSGCGSSDSAAMLIDGPKHSLTLIREKAYLWSDSWDLAMVVMRDPECTRRHHLKPAPDTSFKMEVYRPVDGGWILKQGKRWYIADTASCQLQQYKEPPPEPGNLVGAFQEKDGTLAFVAAPK